jgi:hypothetical protein
MLVEPISGARVEDDFNPVGQFYSGASVLVCTPNALATGDEAIGTVATDDAVLCAGRIDHLLSSS